MDTAQLPMAAIQLLVSLIGAQPSRGPLWNVRDSDGNRFTISLRDFGPSKAVFFEAPPDNGCIGGCTWWVPLVTDRSLERLQQEVTSLHLKRRAG